VKVTTERTPNCSAVVTVEVDDAQVQTALRSAATRVSKIRPIPGFRPGKAPYERVERAVGKDLLLEEAIDGLAQNIYKQVLKDENIDPYDAGKLEVVQKSPVILKFVIPTRPVVTLGDYRSIHLQPKPVEVTEEQITESIERIRLEQATLAPVTRPAQMNDMLTINIKGGIEDQSQLDREGLQVRIETTGATFPWLDQLIGVNTDETRTVTYVYPADASESVAGKTATYTVTVTDIKETQLPELNDEFAKNLGPFETFELLKTRVRASLFNEAREAEENRFTDEVVDAVVAQAQIAYPESMLDDEVDADIRRAKDLAQRLGMTWDKYLELSAKTEPAYREELKPRAESRLKHLLTLMQVVEAEKIEITPKEVDVEIDLRAVQASRQGERADQVRRSLSTPDSRHDIEFNLKIRKAIDFLVASAKGEPTSGKILTPEMVLAEQHAQEQAAATASTAPTGVSPSGLITDPTQVRSQDWPRGLDHPLVPGQNQ